MLEALGVAAVAIALLSTCILVLLVVRRVFLVRAERRRLDTELRLRPHAIALVAGGGDPLPRLDASDEAYLAEVIGRLSRNVRGDARERISGFFAGSHAQREEFRALGDRRAWRRATAAFRLGDMASSEAVPALIMALDDSDRDVRSAAARSLGRLGDARAVAALVDALVGSSIARTIAFRALLDVGAAAIPDLRRLAGHDDPSRRAVALELLGWVGDAPEGAMVAAGLDDASPEVRARAAAALGRLGSTSGAAALERALDDDVYFVRLQAARALGRVGEPRVVPALLRQARTDRFEAARAAAQAVAAIDPQALAAAETPDAGPHIHEAADLVRL